ALRLIVTTPSFARPAEGVHKTTQAKITEKQVMTDISREQVVDYLSNLPVIQIAELIKTLEDKWGVKAAPVAVAAAPGAAAAAPAPAAEAQTEFTVELKEA